MEEPSNSTTNSYCCICLSKNVANSLRIYRVQNDGLKSMFQRNQFTVCYICHKIAKYAEWFFHKVQVNQTLLSNFNVVPETVKSPTHHPLISLTRQSLLPIAFDGNDSVNEELSVVYKNDDNVEIKLEMMDQNGEDDEKLFNHFDDFLGNEPEEENLTPKEELEEDYPLMKLKRELDLEGVDIQIAVNAVKKRKRRKKHSAESKRKELKAKRTGFGLGENKIISLRYTKKQCLYEREQKMQEKAYLEAEYKCEDCVKVFGNRSTLAVHMEKHSKAIGPIECNICKLRMPSKEHLERHQRYHFVRYKCADCDLVRHCRVTIMEHYTSVHREGPDLFPCSYCSKSFKRRTSLWKHINACHLNTRVQCAHCLKSFASKDSLKSHILSMHPTFLQAQPRPKKYPCNECSMSFVTKGQLNHHSVKHSDKKEFYCVECNKSYKTAASLKTHLMTTLIHAKYTDLPFACNHCDKRFGNRRDQTNHVNSLHLNIKPYTCDQCDKAYVNCWSLKEHKMLVHEGYKRPRTFPCSLCDRSFDRKQILLSHIRTHTGERPYQCAHCPAQFSQAGVLNTHIRLIHLRLPRKSRKQ